MRHWDRLKASPDFVARAAFYLATPGTVALARSAVEESSMIPAALFEHIDMHWGTKQDPGTARDHRPRAAAGARGAIMR